MAAGTLGSPDGGDRDDALTLVAAFPTFVAAYWRLSRGEEPVEPDPDLGHAANYSTCSSARSRAPSGRARWRPTWSTSDHGINASTFAARVVASDPLGPGLGGHRRPSARSRGRCTAARPARRSTCSTRSARRSAPSACLREKLARGERLMGFGHRVYKVRDPRADVLAQGGGRLYAADADEDLYQLARAVERTAVRLLRSTSPGRNLDTNVEFYTALLLHGLACRRPVHAHLRGQPRGGLDRPLLRAARAAGHPPAVRVRGRPGPRVGTAGGEVGSCRRRMEDRR